MAFPVLTARLLSCKSDSPAPAEEEKDDTAIAGYHGPSSQESNHVLEISRDFPFYVLLPSCLD